MVAGAHYASDVLWAGVIVLISAAVFMALIRKNRDVPTWLTLSVLLTAALSVVLGNSFNVELKIPENYKTIDLSCLTSAHAVGEPVGVDLKGYGAPLSNLKLYVDEEGTLKLQRWRGLYHSLSCEIVYKS